VDFQSNSVDTYIGDLLAIFELKNRPHLVAFGFCYGLIHSFNGFKNSPKLKLNELRKNED
jgi:hypothetical protein